MYLGDFIGLYNVGETIRNHPPVITSFIGGMFAIPSHGWFMTLFYPHYSHHEPLLTIINHY